MYETSIYFLWSVWLFANRLFFLSEDLLKTRDATGRKAVPATCCVLLLIFICIRKGTHFLKISDEQTARIYRTALCTAICNSAIIVNRGTVGLLLLIDFLQLLLLTLIADGLVGAFVVAARRECPVSMSQLTPLSSFSAK